MSRNTTRGKYKESEFVQSDELWCGFPLHDAPYASRADIKAKHIEVPLPPHLNWCLAPLLGVARALNVTNAQ
jgi:hypothetical protein